MFCSKCGSEVNESANFCSKCGGKLVQNIGTVNVNETAASMKKHGKKNVIIVGFVIAVILLFLVVVLTKFDDFSKPTGKGTESNAVDAEEGEEKEEIKEIEKIEELEEIEELESQDIADDTINPLPVDETEKMTEEVPVESSKKKIEKGDCISGWVEKRHREADSNTGGYDYDYYVLVCDIPYILEVETEEGSFEDCFIEILPRCDEGIENYDRCYIECRLDSAWENLIHGPVTGEKNTHVVVDICNIKVLMEPAKEEVIAEEIYDLDNSSGNDADLTNKICKAYQYLGIEEDSEGKEVYCIDLMYHDIFDAVVADKNGNTYTIDELTDVQLIFEDVEKENLQLRVGSIVGVTGRLYKTTTEGYMYDIYMEVEKFE